MLHIHRLTPSMVIEGGRLRIDGDDLLTGSDLPAVTVGGRPARLQRATPHELVVTIPAGVAGGLQPVVVDGRTDRGGLVDVGVPFASDIHQVDSPVFDAKGRLYVTYSGSRGQQAPVSIFRVTTDGRREPFVLGVTNPTSLAFDRSGRLHVTSRFEGAVYRIDDEGGFTLVASELGVACGLVFDEENTMFVGDRTGTVFRVDPEGRARPFAALPPSIAAFHLALAPDGTLVATGPTLSSRDAIYHIDREGRVGTLAGEVGELRFGRPQGLAIDAGGTLYVAEALAGRSGLYRIADATNGRAASADLVVSGPAVIGAAFGPGGSLVVATADTVFRFTGAGQA